MSPSVKTGRGCAACVYIRGRGEALSSSAAVSSELSEEAYYTCPQLLLSEWNTLCPYKTADYNL